MATAKKNSSKKNDVAKTDAKTDTVKIVEVDPAKVKADAKAKASKVKAKRDEAILEILSDNNRCKQVAKVMLDVNVVDLGDDDFGKKYQEKMDKVFYKLDVIRKAMAKELYDMTHKDEIEAAKIAKKAASKQIKIDKIKKLQAELDAMED